MSENNPRTGTTSISDEIEEARRDAERKLAKTRAAESQAALDAGERERIADQTEAIADEAEEIRLAVARKTPAEERSEAWSRARGHVLLLLLLFLISYLIAAATDRAGIISFPSTRDPAAADVLAPALNAGAGGANTRSIGEGANTQPAQNYQVAPLFSAYYAQQNGPLVFGRPISDVMIVNGRQAQWFERSRLEYWPEHAGTKYEWQPALVGVEFTQGIPFPNQQFFVSNPSAVYSAMTNHGVSQRFYDFWARNGGLDVFGYPISDELQERILTTGDVLTVQYFERGRLEFHPEYAGTANEILIGLLGKALYLNDSAPNIISAAKPTPVPVPLP